MKNFLKNVLLILHLFVGSIQVQADPGIIEIIARYEVVQVSIHTNPYKTLSLKIYNSKGEIFENLKLFTSTDITVVNLHLPKGVYNINLIDIDCGCSNSEVKIGFR